MATSVGYADWTEYYGEERTMISLPLGLVITFLLLYTILIFMIGYHNGKVLTLLPWNWRRIVDGRGRIFGIINLLDFGIIIIVIICMPFGYYVYKILNQPTPAQISYEEFKKIDEAYKKNKVESEENSKAQEKRYNDLNAKYNAEIISKNNFFKEHPRAQKYWQ